MNSMIVKEIGYGGIFTLDLGTLDKANDYMELLQKHQLGYLAVSLGFYKTLFSASGTSTSSEIEIEEQEKMGLSPGLIRFSVGLDGDITATFKRILLLMKDVEVHPFVGGIGKTENLKNKRKEASKRITSLDRLSYTIENNVVTYIACKGHYDFH